MISFVELDFSFSGFTACHHFNSAQVLFQLVAAVKVDLNQCNMPASIGNSMKLVVRLGPVQPSAAQFSEAQSVSEAQSELTVQSWCRLVSAYHSSGQLRATIF
jgi:hypothetical protein